VVKLNREQLIAVGTAGLLLLVCVLLAGFSMAMRSDALQELSERRELLARLETQSRARAKQKSQQTTTTAPAHALLNARTQGLASAELLSYLGRLAAGQQASLISSGIDSARQKSSEVIYIQASMDLRLQALQTVLYQLETGTPYVFVESLTLAPISGAAQGSSQDPTLRVTLVLRALWRREAA
jgi:general secretion pathway protein M